MKRAGWTAIIPAAGRGSRLGYDRPKILYPIAGRPILSWLLDLVSPHCERVVFVLSPSGVDEVEPEIRRLCPIEWEIRIQSEPRGMGDAVLQAGPAVRTENCMVIWGDQVALRSETLERGVAEHESRSGALLTIPTILRKNPYIHFETDAQGRLKSVLEARERPIPHEFGENDCGLFFFDSDTLFAELERARSDGSARGKTTGEFNLLPLLPRFDRNPGAVRLLRIVRPEETYGINTIADAELVSSYLEGLKPRRVPCEPCPS